MTTNHPLLKTALVELARARPRMLPFDVLFDTVWARVAPHRGDLMEPESARRTSAIRWRAGSSSTSFR